MKKMGRAFIPTLVAVNQSPGPIAVAVLTLDGLRAPANKSTIAVAAEILPMAPCMM